MSSMHLIALCTHCCQPFHGVSLIRCSLYVAVVELACFFMCFSSSSWTHFGLVACTIITMRVVTGMAVGTALLKLAQAALYACFKAISV